MLVVCCDDSYLETIEYKLVEALIDKVDISFISDYECLKQYNTHPKQIDILLIEETYFQEVMNKQNCKNVYILVENENIAQMQEKQGNLNIIYKYSSIRVIIDKIDSSLLQKRHDQGRMNTKIISVYSPIGGSGKTTIAVGLANKLGTKGYKVLYISTEMLQDYQYLLEETDYMPEKIGYLCNIQIEQAMESMLSFIKRREFEYFLPWKRMPATYGIRTEHLLQIAKLIQKRNIYDYIVVEVSSEIQEQKLNFLHQSEGVVFVTTQKENEVKRLQKMMDNLIAGNGQGVIVCNQFEQVKANYLEQYKDTLRYAICEYIEKYDDMSDIVTMLDSQVLEKTAMAVL